MPRDAQFYLGHIAAYEREFKAWEGRADKIIKRYRDEKRDRSSVGQAKFNVLWSNVQTLKAATFARVPMPDVSRRFKDNDPVGRVAALILERALEFEVEHYRDFRASIGQCVYDRFLGGRGTAWVRYEPTFKQVQAGALEDGEQVSEDVESESQVSEELDHECAPVDYVHWRDFGHAVSRTWEELPLVWRKVYMTRQALMDRWPEDRFPGLANQIPLDAIPEETKQLKQSTDSDGINKRALVYELWDKENGEAVWFSKSLGKVIEALADPLGLEEFFPCPPPIYSTLTTDTLVPLPDFTLYQDQANELDILSDRIDGLVKALQVKGVYDASVPELARLFTEGENGTLIPVQNWAGFVEKQGLKGALDVVDLLPLAKALAEAYKAFEQIKAQIYELTGIADILRGDTQASETATAQKIKNSYASMRLKVYQDEVERFATRLLQLKAQIICRHFDDATICQISACDQLSPADQQLVPQALALLRSNVMRSFRIAVATDSMVYQDEQQEKQDRMEFLQAVAQFLEKAVQASQQAPQLMPLAAEMLKFGVTGFRVGKQLEGTIDQAIDQLREQAKQPQPNPGAAEAQADVQKTQMQIEADQQSQQAQQQADVAIEQARLSSAAQMEAQRQDHERQMESMRQQHEQSMAAFQAAQDQRAEEMQRVHEAQLESLRQEQAAALAQINGSIQTLLQRMKGEVAIEVAEIGAQTTLDAAQISAAKQSESKDA